MRDLHGQRLSKVWQPGDNVVTVIKKLMVKRVVTLLDPDSYTQETRKDLRDFILREKVKIVGMLIFMMVPLTVYFYMIKPRLERVKRTYFLQFYNKMGFFNKELGVKTKPISQRDLEKNL
jgi:hypothetical protein